MKFSEKMPDTKKWGDFHKWLIDNKEDFNFFKRMPFVYQQGVFLAFLRSEGLNIKQSYDRYLENKYEFYVIKDFTEAVINSHDYNEGLKEAILKAFDL